MNVGYFDGEETYYDDEYVCDFDELMGSMGFQRVNAKEREMDSKKFEELCKKHLVSYFAEMGIYELKPSDFYMVWSVKVLQNNKALFSTDFVDGFYCECTSNGDKKEIYFDIYEKQSNRVVKIND